MFKGLKLCFVYFEKLLLLIFTVQIGAEPSEKGKDQPVHESEPIQIESTGKILDYTATDDEVLRKFDEVIILKPENTPPATRSQPSSPIPSQPDPIKEFREILKIIVRNKVGKFVLIAVINKVTNTTSAAFLKVRINNTDPQFNPPVLGFPRISFAIEPKPLYVIPSFGKTDKTIPLLTPIDVILFHEILHWARFLIVDDFPDIIKNETTKTGSYDHPILRGHPLQLLWAENSSTFMDVCKDSLKQEKGIDIKWHFPQLGVWLAPHQLLKREEPTNTTANRMTDSTMRKTTVRLLPALDIEEVRNIVGGSDVLVYGDEMTNIFMNNICENGYRLVAGLPLRYGHKDFSCRVYEHLIKWCKERAHRCVATVSGFVGG